MKTEETTANEILRKHTKYGNPHSRQDWIHIDGFWLTRHILAAMKEYAEQVASQQTEALKKEVHRLTEIEECQKCTTLNQRQDHRRIAIRKRSA